MTSLSAALANHAATVRYEDLPPRAVHMAKLSLLDWLGVTLAASTLGEGADAFVDLARGHSALDEANVIGHRFKTSATMAALANGAMAHAVDFGDTFDRAPLHPNSPLIPALLAIAQQEGGVSGRDLVAAIAVGCDFTCRLGLALQADPALYGWYTPPILGAFGAAVAVGRILGLDGAAMTDALSLVLCQSTCSAEIKRSPNSYIRAVRDGFSAQAGLLSGVLAAGGVKGFDLPLEGQAGIFQLITRAGPNEAALLEGLGSKFYGEDISFKFWPSCRGTHAYIEAARLILAERPVRPDEIAAIALHGSPVQRMLAEPLVQKRSPQTAIDAKFSLPFTVASTFVHGDIDFDSFLPERLTDAVVLDLANRVTFDDRSPRHQGGVDGELILTLKSGEDLTRYVEFPRGSPNNPATDGEIVAKFAMCARRARVPYSEARIAAIASAVLAIDTAADAMAVLFNDGAL
jgi:2-methylcitrate dehydratase PrpD